MAELINTIVDGLKVKLIDFHQRRITNAADAVNDQDYVTLTQLKQVATAVAKSKNAAAVSGRAYSLSLSGTIGIASDICPRVQIVSNGSVVGVNISLKIGPTGDNFTVAIYQGLVLWMTLSILDGTTSIDATSSQVAGAVALVNGSYWRVDITNVGSTFPGSNITVTIKT